MNKPEPKWVSGILHTLKAHPNNPRVEEENDIALVRSFTEFNGYNSSEGPIVIHGDIVLSGHRRTDALRKAIKATPSISDRLWTIQYPANSLTKEQEIAEIARGNSDSNIGKKPLSFREVAIMVLSLPSALTEGKSEAVLCALTGLPVTQRYLSIALRYILIHGKACDMVNDLIKGLRDGSYVFPKLTKEAVENFRQFTLLPLDERKAKVQAFLDGTSKVSEPSPKSLSKGALEVAADSSNSSLVAEILRSASRGVAFTTIGAKARLFDAIDKMTDSELEQVEQFFQAKGWTKKPEGKPEVTVAAKSKVGK